MFLAIDLGAESGRGIVGALDGDRLTLHEVHRFANETVRLPSGLHWDTPRLWLEIQEALRRAAAFARERGAPLESIGVDAWGVD